MVPAEEGKTLSCDDFTKALGGLSNPEKAFLLKSATLFAAGTGSNPEDLLSEAIARTLEGRRQCPNNIRVATFLRNAMRSIAEHIRNGSDALTKQAANPGLVGHDDDNDPDAPDPIANLPGTESTPESYAQADELSEFVAERIQDDQQAKDVLDARAEGFTKNETCELLDITPNEHDAALKRLRRLVEKEYGRF